MVNYFQFISNQASNLRLFIGSNIFIYTSLIIYVNVNYCRRKRSGFEYICFDSLSVSNTKWIPREKKTHFKTEGEEAIQVEPRDLFVRGPFPAGYTHDARSRCIS